MNYTANINIALIRCVKGRLKVTCDERCVRLVTHMILLLTVVTLHVSLDVTHRGSIGIT